jgi:hypothetical protein
MRTESPPLGTDTADTAVGAPVRAGRWEGWRRDLRAALPGWLAARLLVLAALGVAHIVSQRLDLAEEAGRRLQHGLMSWDALWYLRIANRGYEALPFESVRFFPLLPMLARGLSAVTGGHTTAVLLVLANGPALVLGAMVHRLVLRETGDGALAKRAAWLMALVPPFFVMVMGYSEPITLCLFVGAFLCLRSRRWGWAAAAGFLAGLARPVGVLLAVPAAIEGARGWRAAGAGQRLQRLLPVVTPALGAGSFLTWVWVKYGNFFLPLSVQERSYLRGELANPLETVVTTLRRLDLGFGDDVVRKNAIHLPWLVILGVLLVVVFRRWPVSYGAFAAAMFLVAASAQFLGSFERYAFSGFPLVFGIASVTESEWSERLVLVLAAGGMVAYALFAFLNVYAP